jgi:hypothetical protein
LKCAQFCRKRKKREGERYKKEGVEREVMREKGRERKKRESEREREVGVGERERQRQTKRGTSKKE